MSKWIQIQDTKLKALYSKLTTVYFASERWFADRGTSSELRLCSSLQFEHSIVRQTYLTLNLFCLENTAEYFYYIPLLICGATPFFKMDHLFEKGGFFFYDGIPTSEYIELLQQLCRENSSLLSEQGLYEFRSEVDFSEPKFNLHGSTSNSLLFVSNRYLLKNYRRVYAGINPELSITAALTKMGSQQVPAIYGSWSYQSSEPYTLGIIQEVINNKGSGWELWGDLIKEQKSENETLLLKQAISLGAAIANLHQDLTCLAGVEGEAIPFCSADFDIRIRNLIGILDTISGSSTEANLSGIAEKLFRCTAELQGNLGRKIRIHGDLHLEQVLYGDFGWKILDFEGEPLKSISERGNYDSPLKDIASMMRSVSYRVNTAISDADQQNEYENLLNEGILGGYLETYSKLNGEFLPQERDVKCLLRFFQIERVIYEYLYETKYRPDWVWIPARGVARLLEQI